MRHLKRRFAALLVAAAMAFSLTGMAAAADYADMPTGWSQKAMEAAVENGLLTGHDGRLDPTGNLSRAQMAAVIVRAFGPSSAADLTKYTDVSSDAWYFSEVAQAVQMGVLTGEGSTMAPNRDIARQEVFTVLARALKLEGGTASDLAQFTDSDSIASWAVAPVAAMVKAGYISGSGGKLNPTSPITREEFAQVMHNIFALYITKAGEVDNVPTGNVIINTPDVTLKNVAVSGDLVIGDGVADGDVYLDHVTVSGRVVVRGGGMNSVHFINSTVDQILVSKPLGAVRVVTDRASDVSTVTVESGQDSVIIEGTVEKVKVASSDTPVILRNAAVETVEITASSADVSLSGSTSVDTVSVTAKDVKISTESTVTVSTVSSNVDVTVTGNGTVKSTEGTGAVKDEKGNDVVTPPTSTDTPDSDSVGGGSTAPQHTLTYYLKPGEVDKHYISCSVPNCTRTGHSGSGAHDTAGRNGACSKCGYKDTSTHDKHEVNANTPWEKSADGHWQTCKWVGCLVKLNEGSHDTSGTDGACSVCGYKAGTTCPDGNHTAYSWTTRDETGHVGSCTACGASISGAHTYEGDGTQCLICRWDKSSSQPTECPPNGHTVNTWTYAGEVNGTGTHKGLCSACGNEITANCEDDKTEDEKAPTCTDPGKGATYTCRWCDHISGGEEIPAKGHTWTDGTCESCGATEPAPTE